MRIRVNLRIYDIILHKSSAEPAPSRNRNPNQKVNNEFMIRITIRITIRRRSMIRKNIQAILEHIEKSIMKA
jgi:hypothetical protein